VLATSIALSGENSLGFSPRVTGTIEVAEVVAQGVLYLDEGIQVADPDTKRVVERDM
jgi:hypothetical protein